MDNRSRTYKTGRNVFKKNCFQLTFRENDVSLLKLAKEFFSFATGSDIIFFLEFFFMKKHTSFVTALFIVCCAVICLCSCEKKQVRRSVNQDTVRLMQKTQAELAACVERCRSAAQESQNKEILLALANSQQVLVDRHETIINILLKKYKFEKISTVSYPIEMDPRTIVLAPVPEYREILAKANPEKTLREVLIALEITNKVLSADMDIELMIDPDAEENPELDFYLCPVCGHLSMKAPKTNCPVCHSDKDRQLKLKNGELPPSEQGTFVTVSEK